MDAPTNQQNEYLPQRNFSPEEKQRWLEHIFDIYKRMREKSQNGSYDVKFGDLNLTVFPEVYSLLFFADTFWFAERLSKIVGGKSLLEIGTGTGAIALFCAQNGARVVATDINPSAVKNALLNAKKCSLNIPVYEGNMYEPLNKEERFDFIFWAHPFNNWDQPVEDLLLKSGMDYHYESLRKYIGEAKNHLTPNGKLLLGTGDTADLKTIASFAHENGYKMKFLEEISNPLEIGSAIDSIKDIIYELEPTNKT